VKRIKTKTFGIILESYFRVHIFASLAIGMSIILLCIALILCSAQPELLLKWGNPQLVLSLGALFFVSLITGYNLRRMVMSNAGALYPYYRRKQLTVMLVIMSVFALLPALVISISGFPPLKTLALFTFIPALLLWGGFTFGESGLVVIGTVWLGKTLWDMLGIPSKFVLLPSLFDVNIFGSAAVPALLVSLGSMAAIYRFCRFFLKVPNFKLPLRHRNVTSAYTVNYDRTNWLSDMMTSWSMGRLLKGVKSGKRISLYSSVRLIRPALFSPITTFVSQTLLYSTLSLLVLGGGVYLYFNLFYADKPVTWQDYAVFLIYIYHLTGGFASLDFLQHRHRLPVLWVQLPLPSRRHFAWATALSYVTVMVVQALVISALMLVLPMIFGGLPVMRTLVITAAGCVLMLLYSAFTLMWSNNYNSSDGREYMIRMILIGSYVLLIILAAFRRSLDNTPGAWYVLLGLALAALILVGQAFRKWRNTEMNFSGPELFAPGL
jgi:hypothetical protein